MPDTPTSSASPAPTRRPTIDPTGLRNVVVTLTATCLTKSQQTRQSRLDVTVQPPGMIVENIDGVLTWVNGVPDPNRPLPDEPMAPPGHYQLTSSNISITMSAEVQQPASANAGSSAEKFTSRTLDITHLGVAAVKNVNGKLVNATDSPEATVDAIEVVQAVQDPTNSATLVRGKQTTVRVFVSLTAPWLNGASDVAVSGALSVETTTGIKQSFQTISRTTVGKLNGGSLQNRRSDLDASLNFDLPSEVVDFKNITLERCILHVNRNIQCRVTNSKPASATFTRDPVVLRLRIVALRYQGSAKNYAAPAAIDYDLIRSWLERAFPVSEVRFSRLVTDAGHRFKLGLDDRVDRAILLVAALRQLDIAFNGVDARTHYYGLVLDQRSWVDQAGAPERNDTFMRGQAATIPEVADPSVVAAGPTGTPDGTKDSKPVQTGYSWDTDASYGDWYSAHEIGHTLGLRHVKATGGEGGPDTTYPQPKGMIGDEKLPFVGLDVGDKALKLPAKAVSSSSHDVMSYGDLQWVSKWTSEKILKRLQDEEKLKSDGSGIGGAKTFKRGPALGITLYRTNKEASFTFQYLNPVPGGMILNAPTSGPQAPQIRLTIQRSAAQVKPGKAATPPTPPRTTTAFCAPIGEWDTTVDVVVPTDLAKNERITKVEFWQAGKVEATWVPEKNAASVAITAVMKESIDGVELKRVTWTSTGGSPSYNVFVGRSRTDKWQAVAVGLTEPTFAVDRIATWTASWVSPSWDQLMVRIMATNGAEAIFSEAISLSTEGTVGAPR